MSKYIIEGGNKLFGEVTVCSAKNSILPLMGATILIGGKTRLKNCKKISDVLNMSQILEQLGIVTKWDNDDIVVDSARLTSTNINREIAKKLRGSIFVLGPLLGISKKVETYFPGGCSIGSRPIDLHLDGLFQLGVDIDCQNDKIRCDATKSKGGKVFLKYPSVGATENLLSFAVCTNGVTVIENASVEPEVVDLENFLQKVGAKIDGVGTRTLTVFGCHNFAQIEFEPIPDRIVCATYILSALATKGELLIKNVNFEHVSNLIKLLEHNAEFVCFNNELLVKSNSEFFSLGEIETAPYPGFATDMQSLVMSFATLCKGTTNIKENVFENRFANVEYLKKMGAVISCENNRAIIRGVNQLHGARVFANDLRSGAGLVIAGLCAHGRTIIENAEVVERGYFELEKDLLSIGANVKKEN